jgi:hypothetical protein
MCFKFKKVFSVLILSLILTVYLGFTSVSPAFAFNFFSLPGHLQGLPEYLQQVLSNKQLIKDAKKFLNTTPEKFCQAYSDQSDGVDGRLWEAISQGAESVSIIGTAITSASTAGAGSLAGYAGIASAVSQLGLGGLMQALTGMMGTSVTGAAATAVVTSTVGGPLVMGALLVGGTSAAALGTYELGKFAVGNLENFAESFCYGSN